VWKLSDVYNPDGSMTLSRCNDLVASVYAPSISMHKIRRLCYLCFLNYLKYIKIVSVKLALLESVFSTNAMILIEYHIFKCVSYSSKQ
jgi:hypothetical protein